MTKGKEILVYSAISVVGICFLFWGLGRAQSFLAPLATAIVLSLIVLPLVEKMQGKYIKQGLASFLGTMLLFVVSLGFLALLSFQIKSFVDDWPRIKDTMQPKVEQLRSFVVDNTFLEKKDLEKMGKQGPKMLGKKGSGTGQRAYGLFNSTIGFLGTYLLTFIYVFFLLNYRQRFKEFLLRLFPRENKGEVTKIIQESAQVVQGYLVGKLSLMGLLGVLYAIGLGISGVNNFILASIIAATLTLLPYIGNIIGMAMAMAFGYLTSGETGVLIGILITFTLSQFVESYVLEPYIVGDRVDLHPFMVILVVVLGGALWGIIGMILAIPVTAILAVIFLHVPPLHPFGFLLSKTEQKGS